MPEGILAGASNPGPNAVLVVLAAGASQRFGGVPKALLEVDGMPAVVRLLRVGRESGVSSAAVVVGRHRAEIESALAGIEAAIVVNERWEEGRTGSVQAGLRSIALDEDVLLWPVDHPFVGTNTLRALGAAAHGDPIATWIMPTFQGRGGHPVWLKPAARRAVLELDPDAPLRNVLPRLGPQVRRVPVPDPWIRIGTDTPLEYAEALIAWSRQV